MSDQTPGGRLYFDNAATSWPKRPGVAEAVAEAFTLGASYGRGQSRAAEAVRSRIDTLRADLASLCGVSDSRRIVFTAGGTDGLNLAIRGLLPEGGRAVTTAVEHNSVTRPLAAVAGASVEKVACDPAGRTDAAAFEDAVRRQPPDLVVLTHASNVTGSIQPVAEIAAASRASGAVVVLDVCQTAGREPIDVTELGVDVVVGSGHKELGGPLGTGFVAFADDFGRLPEPLRRGGTGAAGISDGQPEELPQKYEAGSLNVPGLFGLAAALRSDVDADAASEATTRIASWAEASEGVRLVGPAAAARRTSVVSIAAEGWEPAELSVVFEAEFGVETRAGLHCSPDAHRALGTFASGGTLRLSPSWATTSEDVDRLLGGLDSVLG